jgi:hypothetical protein
LSDNSILIKFQEKSLAIISDARLLVSIYSSYSIFGNIRVLAPYISRADARFSFSLDVPGTSGLSSILWTKTNMVEATNAHATVTIPIRI